MNLDTLANQPLSDKNPNSLDNRISNPGLFRRTINKISTAVKYAALITFAYSADALTKPVQANHQTTQTSSHNDHQDDTEDGRFVFYGVSDASGAVALSKDMFIVADDENNILQVYKTINNSGPITRYPRYSPVIIPTPNPITKEATKGIGHIVLFLLPNISRILFLNYILLSIF